MQFDYVQFTHESDQKRWFPPRERRHETQMQVSSHLVNCKQIKRQKVVTHKDFNKKVIQTVVNECHVIPTFHPARPRYWSQKNIAQLAKLSLRKPPPIPKKINISPCCFYTSKLRHRVIQVCIIPNIRNNKKNIAYSIIVIISLSNREV